jgi:hypothetical protein
VPGIGNAANMMPPVPICPRHFFPATGLFAVHWPPLAAMIIVMALCGCASTHRVPATDSSALVMVPANQAGIRDRRSPFRNVFCTVLEARASENNAVYACEDWLVRLPDEPLLPDAPLTLDVSKQAITVLLVPGFASDCVDETKQAKTQFKDYLARFGYHVDRLRVSGISSSESNARLIRDAIQANPEFGTTRKLVIVGHSKGVVDTLEALVSYPELQPKISAVVAIAGAVGGSPLADIAPDMTLSIAKNTPGLGCNDGDGAALESLRPSVRQRWLADHSLPETVPFYSIVTLPAPDRISTGLKPGYNLLSDIDARNDGVLIFYDQVIPGSSLLGYVNADHWAVATDFGSSQYAVVRTLADRSDFPREVLLEAVLRFVELDLTTDAGN